MTRTLEELRKEIDDIDVQIVGLLNKRALVAKEIGEVKKSQNIQVRNLQREKEVISNALKENEKQGSVFPSQALELIYKEIISAISSLEGAVRIAYFGPKATFTHQAAISHFGLSSEYIPCDSIGTVFELVENGNAHYGVVPIENTIEGVVNHTVDILINTELFIVGEIIIPINLFLLSLQKDPAKIRKIYSHKHALAQSRKYLEKHFPYAEILEAKSTANACEIAKEDGTVAAIASEVAAYEYGLHILAKNIQDEKNNFTRFLIIGKNIGKPTGSDKTSLIMGVKNQAGALYKALEIFYKNQINLTKIESRPSKKKAWDYIFYIDLEGHVEDESIKKALEELNKSSQMIKFLGSYPKAQ